MAAGLRLIDRQGWQRLRARAVADELGASTAPVYSNFANLDDLATAALCAARDLLVAYAGDDRDPDPFRNIGMGVLAFVLEHPRLYEALFLEPLGEFHPGLSVVDELAGALVDCDYMAGLDQDERRLMLKKMALFSHGLSVEICRGRLRGVPREALQLLMDEMGRAVLQAALAGPPRTPAERGLLGALLSGPGSETEAGPCRQPKG